MYELLALLTMLLSSYLLVRIWRATGMVEFILIFFCMSTAQIVVWGYLLSWLNCLADVRYWAALGVSTALLNISIAFLNKKIRRSIFLPLNLESIRQFIASARKWYTEELSGYEKLLVTSLFMVVVLLGLANLAVVLLTAPNNNDSMGYHLARMAYYLQNGNLDFFPANYWAQVVHPKNSTLLLLYSYIVSGRNENMTQIVQFISYWISVFSVFGIAYRISKNKTGSIFASLVGALLVETLMESVTTQNDMILTAFFGTTIFSLFSFRETDKKKYLALAALGIGLSVGTKASSFLVLPSVAIVAFHVLFFNRSQPAKALHNLTALIVLTVCALCLFALPAGYVDNYLNLGNPVGPASVRQLHSFEGRSIEYRARNGSKNLLRFGFEFLSLDGLPEIPLVNNAQHLLRSLPESLVRNCGIDLDTSEATIGTTPFEYQKVPAAQEDFSYWGIFGFGLVWIVVILSVFGVIKSSDARILSLSTIVFLICQAFVGPYDPYRGRYFTICAIFAVPGIALMLQFKNRIVRSYLILIVLLGSISALSAVILRSDKALISVNSQSFSRSSIFSMDRLEQITRNRAVLYAPLTAFDRIVPKDATVAVYFTDESYEFPLFGEYLTRTIIPINPFAGGPPSIPASADYLLYESFRFASPNDMYLGANLYLRRLPRG